MNQTKLALPKGRLMSETAALLEHACWGMRDYKEETRSYRVACEKFPDLTTKIFHEKDIPIQVATGNYDLGICGQDWVEELMVKYPNSALVKLKDLGYGEGAVFAVGARNGNSTELDVLQSRHDTVRLVSEYPNLAESYALKLRLRRFSVFPLWGAAEVYPPDSADLALISAPRGATTFNHGLRTVDTVFPFGACLIANRDRWESHDLSEVLQSLEETLPVWQTARGKQAAPSPAHGNGNTPALFPPVPEGVVRLALPDGHQQSPTVELLKKAGFKIDDYPSPTGNRRPTITGFKGISIKVIRPQDMPQQVAAGNFDLAVTGIDWLKDHLYQFPTSPATALLDLKLARVRIVAMVSNNVPVTNGYELKEFWSHKSTAIRVASEYINIADNYARENRIERYRIIPTWGASEVFIPEDADLLIENTQTGQTIARHNLKIIDRLFESTGHLIGNKESITDHNKQPVIQRIIDTLQKAVEN
jgi:ATP phosphoribosyltransferase